MLGELLLYIPPFDFLTPAERSWLAGRTRLVKVLAGAILCDPSDATYDTMYVVAEGRIAVYLPGEYDMPPAQVRPGPTYFGEMSVFFEQRRNARVTAFETLSYYPLAGADVRTLVEANRSFRRAFASILRNKQRIFHGYDTFVSLLSMRQASGQVQLSELISAYHGLGSVLHQSGPDQDIDFDALTYVLPRLPDNITATAVLYLAEDLPELVEPIQLTLKAKSQRGSKRYFYDLLPGKSLVLLRDHLSDTIDIATKLCIYGVETAKVRRRLLGLPVAAQIAEAAASCSPEAAENIRRQLPFSETELGRLEDLFGGDLIKRLYEILAQDGQLTIYFQPPSNRYEKSASENWRVQVRGLLSQASLSDSLASGCDVHIVSSNTHSIGNCLSCWLHEHAEEIILWAQDNGLAGIDQLEPADQLYAAARAWFPSRPEAAAERESADRQRGIYSFDDTSLAGVSLTLVDTTRLGSQLDPKLGASRTDRPAVIVNIDYAYGRQAKLIMQTLILLFGRRIRSISVFGKSGAIVGHRGDVILPDGLIFQPNNELYPAINQDLVVTDFAAVGYHRAVHEGTMLTVLGTVMQNREMLNYYRTFWDVVGMEMEGAYYLREILQAQLTGLIDDDIQLRFAYYTSDTPLEAGASLATGLTLQEGVPAVYAITRAVLKRILAAGDG